MHRVFLRRAPWARFDGLAASSRISLPRSAGRSLVSTAHRTQLERPANPSTHATRVKEENAAGESEAPSTHIPWYLQEEGLPLEPEQVASRDKLPELPEDPPQILPVLLDYTFKDLGLDELKLFDLRGLETPAALGANVIMVIGTARSVKHLNVSADRLCRWLRTNYKLTPYADGLLGRNELKIKLRRKARRARVATRSGATFDEKDDGITTGWICVNAGVVEKAPAPETPDPNFEGFGSVAAGTRVVVQIFTEEKRAETDLDGLWQSTLDRAERQQLRASQEQPDAPSPNVRSRAFHPTQPLSSDCENFSIPRSPVNLPFEQIRRIHSSRSIRSLHQDPTVGHVPPKMPVNAGMAGARATAGMSAESLLGHLSRLPDEKALWELGDGPADRSSTLFLQLFHGQLAKRSEEEAALARMELSCIAIARRHPAYSKESLCDAFKECSAVGYRVSDNLGLQVASALLTSRPTADAAAESPGWLPLVDRELALVVFNHLSLRGTDLLNLNILNPLYHAATLPAHESLDPHHGDPTLGSQILSWLAGAIDRPFHPDEARPFMATLFRNGDFDRFWTLWRRTALQGRPHPPADYAMLFQLHADLGDVRRARDVVTTWAPMMGRETPPVPVQGPVAEHLVRCILLVDPAIRDREAEGVRGGFVPLWAACREGLSR
ncbi:RsfS/YbeB/iojap family protein [Aspergillus candidus]|uniref:ATPase synthesis protein 25 n=1 Tax=Aspergillus candidus TaxID=41067 RepID=A0A2I2FMA9_ASPCN|nr:ATPase synthesis protein 25, mitochondrial [Aspergillus candidus]PLB41760.1 ATPase synthesis protein 25, mitochondrial [Aspergillus candidus]